jgi:predicted DsbA family dithiol-disulfide isomerase
MHSLLKVPTWDMDLVMNSDIILYSDFNCPFCYALGERLLVVKTERKIEWRGVQHAPYLTTPMADANAALAAELKNEVSAIQHLAPEVPITLPRGKPNTGPAIRAVAAALKVDKDRAHTFKDSLYREFWRRGIDISDASVLQALAKNIGLPDVLDIASVTPATGWQHAWETSGLGGVPAMVRSDGKMLVGLASIEEITSFLNSG